MCKWGSSQFNQEQERLTTGQLQPNLLMDACGICRHSLIIMQCHLRMKSLQTKMSNRSYYCVFLCLVVFLLTFISQLNCKTPSTPAIFVFGDSLFDSGNNNRLPTLAKANFLPYSAEFIDGASRRFTNNGTLVPLLYNTSKIYTPQTYPKYLLNDNLAKHIEVFLMKQGGQEVYVCPLGRNSCHLINYFEVCYQEIISDPAYLDKVMADGAEKASKITDDTLSNVYQVMVFFTKMRKVNNKCT